MKKYIQAPEAAARLGLSIDRIVYAARNGRIPGAIKMKVGGHTRGGWLFESRRLVSGFKSGHRCKHCGKSLPLASHPLRQYHDECRVAVRTKLHREHTADLKKRQRLLRAPRLCRFCEKPLPVDERGRTLPSPWAVYHRDPDCLTSARRLRDRLRGEDRDIYAERCRQAEQSRQKTRTLAAAMKLILERTGLTLEQFMGATNETYSVPRRLAGSAPAMEVIKPGLDHRGGTRGAAQDANRERY